MNKRLLLILFISFWTSFSFAQDVLVMYNGDEIQCKVISISSGTINYTEYGDASSIKTIPRTAVMMILYENDGRGPIPQTSTLPTGAVATEAVNSGSKTAPKKKEKSEGYEGNGFMLGFGYGVSYGMAGISLGGRMGGNVGVGFHAGVGMGYSDLIGWKVLATGGVKFYPYKWLYLDAQFGLTNYEKQIENIWGTSGSSSSSEEHYTYGPSVLVGIDMSWGSFGLNAGVGMTYNFQAEFLVPEYNLAVDLGVYWLF